MKKILTILILLIAFSVSRATTYQIANQTAFNAFDFSTLVAGDVVQIQKGQSIVGSITISDSGAAGNPITFGAYGTGANPIITGFTTITEWTDLGSNVWESTSAVSVLSTLNMVSIGGVNTAMGRYPNADAANGGYLTFQSHSGTTSLTSSGLDGVIDWTGAEAVIRTLRYVLARTVISSQSGSTLTYAAVGAEPTNGYGFFIQNDSRTLDYQNEWYYNTSTKKISIYSVGQPANVKVATIDKLLTVTGDYVTIDGIDFTGANETGVFNSSSTVDHFVFLNCSILFSGIQAIQFQGSYLTVENNTISDSNYKGVNLSNSNNVVFRNNTVQNTCIHGGQGRSSTDNSHGLVIRDVATATVEYNRIINTGYCGIYFYGSSITIKNNFIDTFCSILDDGGGIYTYTGGATAMTNCKIEGNIVLNGIGAFYGTDQTYGQVIGIYLDDNAKNTNVLNNTIISSAYIGLFVHNASYCNISGNTMYSNGIASEGGALVVKEDNLGLTNEYDTISNNIFIARDISQYSVEYRSDTQYINRYGSFANNYYIQLASLTTPIRIYTSVVSPANYSLAYWQATFSQDLNSESIPLTTMGDIQFEYNATSVAVPKSISVPKVDLNGTKYVGTVTLQPYTSVVLFVDPNPAPTRPIFSRSGKYLRSRVGKIILY